MPTARQIMAAKTMVESGRKGEALVKAGYSPNTALAPTKVTESKGFKEAAKPIIKKLERLRDQAIERAFATGDKATYSEAIRGVDVLTGKIELLSGRPTDRTEENNLSNLSTEELLAKLDAIRSAKDRGGDVEA